MGIRQKQEKQREKNIFAFENKEFICRYDLIAKMLMSKKKIKKELNLSTEQFNELEAEYLRLFYGIQ